MPDYLGTISRTRIKNWLKNTDNIKRDSLKKIYETIDELEKTETEQRRYLQYVDYAVEPIGIAGVTLPPLLVLAFGLLVFEQLLGLLVFRSLP